MKISPVSGVIDFGKRSNLSLQYIGPDEIAEDIGNAAYRLDLHLDMSFIHQVFHVSILRKLVSDRSTTTPLKGVGVEEILIYEMISIEILGK